MAVNLDEIRKKYEELKKKKGGGDDNWMELQDGDNLVRFLSDEDGNFYHETGYHYIKQGKDKVAVICNRLNSGDECYLCDVVSELYKSKDKNDKELAKEIGAKPRIFFNILDREDDNKVKILGAGNMIFKDLLKYFADEDWGDLTDPKTGHDVVINKTGEKMDTVYTVMPKPKPTKMGVDDVELHDLAEIAEGSVFTNDEQERILDGTPLDDILAARKGGDKKEDKKDKKDKKEDKPQPSRKPTPSKKLSPEEQYHDKLCKIDLDIPKARKAMNTWLNDEDRTEEELDEIIEKYGLEDDSAGTEAGDDAEAQSSEEGDLDDEVAKALAKFKKNKK